MQRGRASGQCVPRQSLGTSHVQLNRRERSDFYRQLRQRRLPGHGYEHDAVTVPLRVDLMDRYLRVPPVDGFLATVQILQLPPHDELMVVRLVLRSIVRAIAMSNQPDGLKLVLLGQESEIPFRDMSLIEG